MVVKEIWITRHGFREDWVTDTPHLPTGRTNDPPLSELGRKQAAELGEFLKDKGIERVYCSPFYRCLETVTPLVKVTDIPLYVDYAMSEWYGAAYDHYLLPAPTEELKKHFPHINTDHVSSIELPSGIETVKDCHDRVRKGVERLLEKLDSGDGPSTILLAGHAASVICAIRGLLKDERYPVRCGTCSVSKLVRKQDGWELVINGDCSHLSDGEQRSWTFAGDIPDYEKKKMTVGAQ